LCGFVLEKDAIQSVIIVNKFMPEHSAAVELAAKNAADALILDVREVVKQGQKPS
jgi:hypothetical protein